MGKNGNIANCRVCVIGGAGFLGSHLVDHLINDRQCHVLVLDNLTSGLRKHVHEDAQFEKFDICCPCEDLTNLFKQWAVDWVFNYAAEPYIPECYDNPQRFFDVNARGALHVLNAGQVAGVKGILQVSSAEIYGETRGKIKENDPVIPHSTYGVSKVAADGLVQVRWMERRVPAIAMRQFNCVGERETHDYVVPAIISRIHNSTNDEITLGNNSMRDFQYAGDAVRMAVELLECGQFGEVYNMGSEECIRIWSLARIIAELMGKPSIKIVTDPELVRPWEIWSLQSDNAKLYSVIGARPKVGLREALNLTIAYFKSNNFKWDW